MRRRQALDAIAMAALAATASMQLSAAVAPDLGKSIAEKGTSAGAPPCVTCHGVKGEGNAAAGFPRLAGLGKGYVARQIEAFARDQRASAIMAPIAKALTPPESSAVAGYFAALTPPPISFSNARRQVPAAALAQDGRWQESRLPACVQCHGPEGIGVGDDFPPLAGQPAAYVAAQLRAWQQGTRPAGPQGLMQVIAKRLTAEDIEAVSGYFGVASVDAGKAAEEPTQPTHQVTLAPVSGGARTGFAPPPENAIPDDELGRLVRLGKLIFTETQKYAAAYVGNDLRCSNCHLDAGRLGHSAPLWGAYVAYPQYRAKTRHVDSYAERLQGCFLYSMNGSAPPLGSEVLAALETYSYWLATGAPVNTRIEGSGYPRLPSPKDGADYDRGRRVYDDKCALCHRSNGEGQRAGAAQVFPPLWGPRSYNWGAGMHQVNNAAAFIKANMPFGDAGTLTEQQAWDVAYYMDAHERPQDPRFTVSITDTRRKFHDSADSLYGVTVNGQMLGRGTDPEKGR